MEWEENINSKDNKSGSSKAEHFHESEPYTSNESKFKINVGVTISMGNYESMRIEEGLVVPSVWNDRNEVFRQAVHFLQERVRYEIKTRRREVGDHGDPPMFDYSSSENVQVENGTRISVGFGRTVAGKRQYEFVRIDITWQRWVPISERDKASGAAKKWVQAAVETFVETQDLL